MESCELHEPYEKEVSGHSQVKNFPHLRELLYIEWWKQKENNTNFPTKIKEAMRSVCKAWEAGRQWCARKIYENIRWHTENIKTGAYSYTALNLSECETSGAGEAEFPIE